MAKGGAFTDRDTSEVEDFIERKLLHRGVLGRFSRVDGVSIRPVVSGLEGLGRKERKARRQEVPGTWIGRVHPPVGARARPPAGAAREGGHDGGTARGRRHQRPRGAHVVRAVRLPLPRAAATDVVRFSLDAMRALGAEPADGRWEWDATIEVDTTVPAGS